MADHPTKWGPRMQPQPKICNCSRKGNLEMTSIKYPSFFYCTTRALKTIREKESASTCLSRIISRNDSLRGTTSLSVQTISARQRRIVSAFCSSISPLNTPTKISRTMPSLSIKYVRGRFLAWYISPIAPLSSSRTSTS